jgi:hypothetical protein
MSCIVLPVVIVLLFDAGCRTKLLRVRPDALTTPVTTALGMYPKEGNTMPWLAPWPQDAIAFTIVPAGTENGALYTRELPAEPLGPKMAGVLPSVV